MSLDRDQTIDLLTVIAAYDRRSSGEGDIAAWSEAARRAGWTFPEAVEAVHAYFAESSKWLMPGDVTERIRVARRQPAAVSDVLALEKKPSTPERRAEFMAQMRKLAGRKGMPR
ncbi:hypothetical protein [Gordonia cholesterolivorans]|uniref:Replicative helicase inhibitor G39P N-terminal domain-containing protein n=1 Tax=Gordonia cholesterolivorans TaxID=559625 RepID=A0ABN3HCY3_9ACTN